jgi:uncharacterized protein GlcG (DUF336 family)
MTLTEARIAVDAALAEAERIGARVNIAVVDGGGNLVAHVRMDRAFFGSVGVSIDKAWTSAAFRMATSELAAVVRPTGPAFGLDHSNGGRVMPFPGGLPIFRDGELYGAIGVSGSTVEDDVLVAEAGRTALLGLAR